MGNKSKLFGVSFACLVALSATLWGGACTRYIIKDRSVLADLNYAKPAPGHFKYIKRNVTATAVWDSETSKEEVGSRAYMDKMTSLAVQATKQLLYKVNLQHNQALYNVRMASPNIVDRYFWYAIFLAGTYFESRITATITADVIEFI